MSIEAELIALKRKDGLIVAEDVLSWAEKHRSSEIAKSIEWDNSKAAHDHRLWQVRKIIALNITYEGGERKFVSLSIDRVKTGGGYRMLDSVVRSRSLHKILLEDALRELERVQEHYTRLVELAPVWREIEKVRARTTAKKGVKKKAS